MKLPPQQFGRWSNQFSLRQVLIVPFVLQIFGTVSLVGYLSFRNGQQMVSNLANHLMDNASRLVDQHLDSYLNTPHQINQVNRDAAELGLLNLNDFEQVGRFFWKQIQIFNVGYINYANASGEFIGVERRADGQFLINETLKSSLQTMSVYQTDQQGRRFGHKLEAADPIQQEGWYADAVSAKRPIWSRIYQWDDQPQILSISSSYPIYDANKKLVGVLGVDLLLSGISQFLHEIQVSPSARIFIIERDGRLVATSSKDPVYAVQHGAVRRLSAAESPDPLIRGIAQQIDQRFGSFKAIDRNQTLRFTVEQQSQFVQIVPWQDHDGLNWIVVVAVPASDFMTQINQNTRTTILLCIVALLLSILVGISTARWVTQPILDLNRAAKAISRGDLSQRVNLSRRDVLGELTRSFNGMAAQLQVFFQALEQTNQELEQRVADRTTSLHEKNQELSQTLQALQTTQAELIQSEKMAILGQLVAGIAHEINTPLGAIRASIGNITSALDASVQQLPKLFQILSAEELANFFLLLDQAKPHQPLSFREERQLRRTLKQALVERSVVNSDAIADSLSKMGIQPEIDQIMSLLRLENNLFVIETAYQLSIVQNNSHNIVIAVERAAKIVFALKSYARHDTSGQMIEASVIDSIDTTLMLYHNHLKRGVEVQKAYAQIPKILCYPEELTQVWANLIHNALQAMEYRGNLKIAVFEQEQNIIVSITDSGSGVPPEIAQRIFDPFFTTKPTGEGTGLGLDIVRRIVSKHHGKVELNSQPEHTTFSVWLPISS
jgi:C4-dicarboxylate-specific signal transduction histidine kinase